MLNLDKKQKLQVLMLSLLSLGLFGYFAVKMITPSPAGAHSAPAPTLVAAAPSGKATAPTAKGQAAPVDPNAPEAPVPPPSADMRDPFRPGLADQGALDTWAKSRQPAKSLTAKTASGNPGALVVPSAPPLPMLGGPLPPTEPGVAPLPVAPSAPSWTLTGVLQGGPSKVAVLRSGEARRFVRQGDSVDSQFRLVSVTRSAAVLSHAATHYTLLLVGPKAAPVAKKASGQLPALTQTAPLQSSLGQLPALPQASPQAASPLADVSLPKQPLTSQQ